MCVCVCVVMRHTYWYQLFHVTHSRIGKAADDGDGDVIKLYSSKPSSRFLT